jgi:hypothetical protein
MLTDQRGTTAAMDVDGDPPHRRKCQDAAP